MSGKIEPVFFQHKRLPAPTKNFFAHGLEPVAPRQAGYLQ
jgi:hypothetical protein